jgi:hypothetical protein
MRCLGSVCRHVRVFCGRHQLPADTILKHGWLADQGCVFLPFFQVTSMPIHMIHATVSVAFCAVIALIGEIMVRGDR